MTLKTDRQIKAAEGKDRWKSDPEGYTLIRMDRFFSFIFVFS